MIMQRGCSYYSNGAFFDGEFQPFVMFGQAMKKLAAYLKALIQTMFVWLFWKPAIRRQELGFKKSGIILKITSIALNELPRNYRQWQLWLILMIPAAKQLRGLMI